MSKDLSSLFNETVEGDEDIWHSFAGGQQNLSQELMPQQAEFNWGSSQSSVPAAAPQVQSDWKSQPQQLMQHAVSDLNWDSSVHPTQSQTFDWLSHAPAKPPHAFDWKQSQPPAPTVQQYDWNSKATNADFNWDASAQPIQPPPIAQPASAEAPPPSQPVLKGFSIDDDVVEEPKAPSPVRVVPQAAAVPLFNPAPAAATNLIAARRLQQQQQSQDIFKPEQDVIFKQYNPNPTPVMPPPGIPPLSASPPPRMAAGPPQPAFVRQPSPYVVPLGLIAPVTPVAPTVLTPVPPSLEMEKKRTAGLKAFVSIGFGGRLVMAGGLLGSRVKLGCLGETLGHSDRTRAWINEVKNAPCALGTVSDLTTETVQNFCRSINGPVSDRFGIAGMKDSGQLMGYMSSQLNPKPTGLGALPVRTQFIANMWDQATHEYSMDHSSVLFQYLDKVVRGDMRGSIEVAKSNPALHPICLAISSIHSAEFFRESILSFTQSLGISSGLGIDQPPSLIELVKTCLTAFASTGAASDVNPSVLSLWKLHMCLAAALVKPGDATGGGVNFLLRLGNSLCMQGNTCGGHLCIILSNKGTALDSVDAHDSLMCLLGADHRDISHFYRLLDSGPIIISEFFEYVARFNSGPGVNNSTFFISLQPWKFAYASMLACDLGFFDLAERYVQVINAFVRAVPTSKYTLHFRNGLRDLEKRMHQSKEGGNVATSDTTSSSLVGISDVGQAALGAIWGSIKAVASTR